MSGVGAYHGGYVRTRKPPVGPLSLYPARAGAARCTRQSARDIGPARGERALPVDAGYLPRTHPFNMVYLSLNYSGDPGRGVHSGFYRGVHGKRLGPGTSVRGGAGELLASSRR